MSKYSCPSCKQFLEEEQFAPSLSKWSATGRSDYCIACLEKKIDDVLNLTEIDSLMRHLDVPFLLDRWMSLARTTGKMALRTYFKMFAKDAHYENNLADWSATNAYWRKQLEEDTLHKTLPELSAGWLTEMRSKWQADYSTEQYMLLEDLYNNLLKSQNILPGMSQSFAIMLCKLIMKTNQDLRDDKPIKDNLAEIKGLMAVAGFETKGARTSGDFDTMGELMVWLSKKGWEPKFYNGEIRDEVDLVIRDTQAFLRRLVLNEPSLPDLVQQRKEAFIASKELENEVFMDDKTFDEYENHMLTGVEYEGEIDLDEDDDDE